VPRDDVVDDRLGGAQIGDVEGGGEGLGNALGDLAGPLGVAAIDPDHRARRRHAARDLEPEPAGGAGNQGDAPRQGEALEPRGCVGACH